MKSRKIFALVALAAMGFAVPSTATTVARPANPAPAKRVAGAPAAAAALDPEIAVKMADDYFNAMQIMTADFVQIGADGRRAEGKLYIKKPGRLRFEYALPATLEIIADGRSVAIHDRKLSTQDIYFVAQTPLKFLLKDNIDLTRDTKVLNVINDGDNTIIEIEDKATLGGTSRIKLYFDKKSFSLKQWQVVDPQGFETLVSIFNVDPKTEPNPALFKIDMDLNFPH